MVYYLRPRKQEMSYKFPVGSESESDSSKKLVPYLVIVLLVTIVSGLVILFGVKPDLNGFSFLCVKDENGKHKVCNMRVGGLSLLIGLLVAAGVYGVNKAKPELLAL
jgi:hypothetical protein